MSFTRFCFPFFVFEDFIDLLPILRIHFFELFDEISL